MPAPRIGSLDPRSALRRLGRSLATLAAGLAIAGATTLTAGAGDLDARVRDAVLTTYIHGMTDEIALAEVGHEGLPALRALLSDRDFPRRDNVVAFVTHLGGTVETDALLQFLESPPTSVERPEDDRALLLAPQALGHIAARGDGAALAALLDMTSPDARGGILRAAATSGDDPGSLRDDLLEMALRGLAFSGSDDAEDRLAGVASGRVVPARNGRSLQGAAQRSLDLFSELHVDAGSANASPATDGEGSAEASGAGTLDSQSLAHDTGLTYANHPAVTNPMTDARLDDVLGLATLRMGRGDATDDVACCATLSRLGSAVTFGAPSDGLDSIDDGTELNAVLNDSAARFKVVRAINYCGGAGTNIIGCAWRPGNGAAVVRRSNLGSETVLWAHEYGHNVGLTHNQTSGSFIMFGTDYGTNERLTQPECDKFHFPSSSAGASPIEAGSCTDIDGDLVHGVIDNCPGLSNSDQTDTDSNGVGDACDSSEPFCGNGVAESAEQCDSSDLSGQSCQSAGFDGGSLSCFADCTLDTTACTICGDGVRDSGEACDGSDLGGETCQSRGFDSGSLFCSASCTIDESSCACVDADGDGVTGCGGDCDDGDSARYPGAQEVCNDGIDQDCNGRDKTKGCGGKKGGGGNGGGGGGDPGEHCKNGVDDDGDGLVDCADSECSSKKFCR